MTPEEEQNKPMLDMTKTFYYKLAVMFFTLAAKRHINKIGGFKKGDAFDLELKHTVVL